MRIPERQTDPKLVAKFRQRLLELTPDTAAEIDGQRIKVLKAAWVDGFDSLRDSDYDGIREMLRSVNMLPYQEF
jgi:phosphonate transport system substrate-binding protein